MVPVQSSSSFFDPAMGGDGEACDWQINESELELDARIGMGSFGEVYKGSWRGTDVAVKRILEQDFTEQHMKVGCHLLSGTAKLLPWQCLEACDTLTTVSKDTDCRIKVPQYTCHCRLEWPMVLVVSLFDTSMVCFKIQCLSELKYMPSFWVCLLLTHPVLCVQIFAIVL